MTPEDPFQVLVAVMLSARTKDPTTNEVMRRLWPRAHTPQALLKLPEAKLAEALNPVGFYRTKAKQLQGLCRMLVEEFDGKVPDTLAELERLPGVGRKTANLVLSICFEIPAICVDTHVHRIANRLGWVKTKTPPETEEALMALFAKKHWGVINRVLVNHGQRVCNPIGPRCSECVIARQCPRTGVVKPR